MDRKEAMMRFRSWYVFKKKKRQFEVEVYVLQFHITHLLCIVCE